MIKAVSHIRDLPHVVLIDRHLSLPNEAQFSVSTVITLAIGRVILLWPPLIIPAEELDFGVLLTLLLQSFTYQLHQPTLMFFSVKTFQVKSTFSLLSFSLGRSVGGLFFSKDETANVKNDVPLKWRIIACGNDSGTK